MPDENARQDILGQPMRAGVAFQMEDFYPPSLCSPGEKLPGRYNRAQQLDPGDPSVVSVTNAERGKILGDMWCYSALGRLRLLCFG
jgi:hypothetical protein